METSFGVDFSRVRVHADSLAALSSRAVHAQAYTVANHVVFADKGYAPDTAAGRNLIAHELTHVVQQGNRSLDGAPAQLRLQTSAEGEADDAAQRFGNGASIGPVRTATEASVQPQIEPLIRIAPETARPIPFEMPLEGGEAVGEGLEPEFGAEEAPEFGETPGAEATEPEIGEPTTETEVQPEPMQIPEPGPVVAPQPGEVPTEEEPDKCPPSVAPPPGPMPPKPAGVRVRLVLPPQKSAGDQLASYQRYLTVLEHDIMYARGNTAQSATWDRSIRPGGAHGMRPDKYHEGRILGIPRDRIFRPDWTRLNANIPTMQVDHIIELQLLPVALRGGWGDTFDNYELLDQRSNTSSGRNLQINVAGERARLYALTCDPRWLTCHLRFDDLVETGGAWRGARWSSDEITNGEHIDAWRRLQGGGAPAAVPPPVTAPTAARAAARPPADFSSTLQICQRVLQSRDFPVRNGGVKVTIGAHWELMPRPGPQMPCDPTDYSISLYQKGLIFDHEIHTWTVPAGRAFNLTATRLEPGDYYLFVFVPESHYPDCCLRGDVSVLTFDAPRTRRLPRSLRGPTFA